jgi:hypothetical protein
MIKRVTVKCRNLKSVEANHLHLITQGDKNLDRNLFTVPNWDNLNKEMLTIH